MFNKKLYKYFYFNTNGKSNNNFKSYGKFVVKFCIFDNQGIKHSITHVVKCFNVYNYVCVYLLTSDTWVYLESIVRISNDLYYLYRNSVDSETKDFIFYPHR